MKRFKEYDEMVNFIVDNLEEKDNITCVLHEDTLDDVLVLLDEYIYCEVDEINKDISEDQNYYIVTKITNEYREVGLIIEPLCFETENDEVEIKEIYGEIVIIEDGALEDFEKDEVEFEDELIEVFCNEVNEIDDYESCEENCNDDMNDVIELYTQLIQDTQGCPGCIADILEELIEVVYESGYNDALRESED